MHGTFASGEELKMIPVLKGSWDREDGGIVDCCSKTRREGVGRREEELVFTCRFSFGKRTSGEDTVETV